MGSGLLAWRPISGDTLALCAGVMRVRLLPFIIVVTIGKMARYARIAGGATGLSNMFSG